MPSQKKESRGIKHREIINQRKTENEEIKIGWSGNEK